MRGSFSLRLQKLLLLLPRGSIVSARHRQYTKQVAGGVASESCAGVADK